MGGLLSIITRVDMKDIAIYGAGGFGREVLTLVEEVNRDRKEYNFIGFFDDGKKKGEVVNNYPVIGMLTF